MKRNNNWLNHFLNFLAVILGVYLAFYVNERAKISENTKESIVLMKSLFNDLKSDIAIYEDFQIPENTIHKKNVDSLLISIINNRLDSIDAQLPFVFQVQNFAPNASTYSSLKSSGKLGLIEDLDLQKKLSEYYDGTVIESSRKGEFQAEYFTDVLLDWSITNIDLLEMKLLKKDDLLVFKNMLVIYSSLIEQKTDSYRNIVEEAKILKNSIEMKINH